MLRKIFAKVSGKSEQQVMNDQLRKAAIQGKLPRAQKLVQEGAEVDYKDVNGLTPLYFAVSRAHLDVTRFLLEQGADVNIAREDSLGPPLVQAGYNGRLELIKLLLEHKADIDAINYSKRTALHEAAWRGEQDAGILLLQEGANPNTVDRMGSTPLRDAVAFGYQALALKLAECGADGGVEYKYGDDLRTKALKMGWDNVVAALDDYTADLAQAAAAEKAALDKNVAKADTLQNDIAIKKPISFKPK